MFSLPYTGLPGFHLHTVETGGHSSKFLHTMPVYYICSPLPQYTSGFFPHGNKRFYHHGNIPAAPQRQVAKLHRIVSTEKLSRIFRAITLSSFTDDVIRLTRLIRPTVIPYNRMYNNNLCAAFRSKEIPILCFIADGFLYF